MMTPLTVTRTSATNGKIKPKSHGSFKKPGPAKGKNSKQTLWSPWKLILFSVMAGIAGLLYLTHVFQTQDMLREVQELRRDYERTHRIYVDTRRNYERVTGPAEVYRRAESAGMISGGAMDPVIILPE